MGIVSELVRHIPIPKMVKVKQRFDADQLDDVVGELRARLQAPEIRR